MDPLDIEKLFVKSSLIPAIIQDQSSGNVLMLAYMNQESLQKTIETKETWFYSRSREALWNKGATSGNKQIVHQITYDCDADSLLITVDSKGPACHTGEETCFHHTLYQGKDPSFPIIQKVASLIKSRKQEANTDSYTAYLFREGIDKILKKVGEETSEVIIGAKNQDNEETIWEIADLTYHILVLMEQIGITESDIKEELNKRHLAKEGK
ncbi:bifunctional phosphoribosyl-AMP cyclohydrolase/phosphoribosyl-ATP diphosphatase HisIE [Ornithinibacillus sp. BX22]|uniref:Histidine biosynthesis bifunctional protein HisIE n=2 Tax=Ornithinibacillus TaxID=484508 RepID=A0A923L5N2_9BACI|nr:MULTISPECIES: bifunctional phosphoribosyl-AMP cyclohydrolase/phosphoribosyl-ATP diphosphatase HisIE [Ornithinibacillus]MBC5636909.1 bifunctional phosphoribosyl-AMP cyclohydrolase/phosphoribosyl-ATP diphosphatase HisIE [Ornithinibacillus hominis]MBS3681474.1 bifunctional phosphoribosyl-AMP cyclohydrolase/phosphoribosyl-ATP diphosphatase HisIE [Ornithinibacillus massiliensis]